MSVLLLPLAVGGIEWKMHISFRADGLLTVVFMVQHSKQMVVDSSMKPQNKGKSGLLLDIIVGQCLTVLKLLSLGSLP